jgi:hypothetical protein
VLPAPGHDSGHDHYDEVAQFGSGRTPGGRWLPRVALACLVVAAIVTVAVRGTGHTSPQSAKAPRPPPAIRVITVGHPLLGETTGWELFARGPDDLLRVQLAQGKISVTYVPPLLNANPNVAFVIGPHEAVIRSPDLVPGYVVPDGAQARPLTGPLAGGGPLIPGPARAQAWIAVGWPTSPVLSLVALSGLESASTIRFPPDGPQLPATAVPDGRGYVLVTSESFSAYDAGPGWDRPVPGTIVAVGRTAWLVSTCDPPYRHCGNEVVDIADGARRTLPGPAVGDPFLWPPTGVIAPDGSTAAVAESDRDGGQTVHLINLRTGANHDLKIPLGADLNAESMVWSPDSRWLFVAATGGKLVAVDASTDRAERLQIPLPAVAQVAIRS